MQEEARREMVEKGLECNSIASDISHDIGIPFEPWASVYRPV
jgi:hypothetical protein